MRRLCLIAAPLFSLFAASSVSAHIVAPAAAAAPVSIIDIGGYGVSPNFGPSAALAVSNGLVVGYAQTAGASGVPNAIATRGSGLMNIGAGLDQTVATAINSTGTVVGLVSLPGSAQQRAAEFSAGHERDLGLLPGDASNAATGINTAGTIVGNSFPATSGTYVSQAFVFANGVMHTIPALRALPAFRGANAEGINDAGTVVGSVGHGSGFFLSQTSSYAVSGSNLTLFANVHGSGGNSQATAINAQGVVVGYESTFGYSFNAPLHAYTYALKTGVFTDLGTLYPNDEFAYSFALGINSAGTVVGYSFGSHGQTTPHAAVFAHGTVTDLNSLLPANSGWILETATGIDDLGNIVGNGVHGEIQRGFILRTGARFAAHSTAATHH
jgi:probable HAF family extracellular repeat protein